MTVSTRVSAAVRRRPGTGLSCLVMSGLLWGTGGLTGSLLSRAAGLPAISVAAYRLTVGGALIIIFLTLTGRPWPTGRAAWTRITEIGLLAALFQSCYFMAVSLTSVSLATLLTIGSAPVIVLAADQVTGRRRIGRRTAGTTCLALAGLGLLVGLPSGGFPETAVLASAGMAVLAAAARPHDHRLDDRARHRTDSSGLLAVLPRPAQGFRWHRGAAGAPRAADRCHPRGIDTRRPAQRHRNGRCRHARGGSGAHGAKPR